MKPIDSLEISQTVGRRTSKWSHFWPIYDTILTQLPEQPTVVEVGVLGGGSLDVWSAALGASALIVGVDLNPAVTSFSQPNVKIIVGDCALKETWQSVRKAAPHVDLIIDDGPHTFSSQIATVFFGAQVISPLGGWIVIEDTHTSYFKDDAQFGPSKFSFMRFVYLLSDVINAQSTAIANGGGARHQRSDILDWLAKRIDSIAIHESLVVLRMKPEADQNREHRVTDNGGNGSDVIDFRNRELDLLQRAVRRSSLDFLLPTNRLLRRVFLRRAKLDEYRL